MGSPSPSIDAIAAHWGRNDDTGNFEIFSDMAPIDGNFLWTKHLPHLVR